MVGDYEYVSAGVHSRITQPIEQPAELLVGLTQGASAHFGADTVGVLRLVRLGEPDESNRRLALGKHILGGYVHRPHQLVAVGLAFGGPFTEPGDDFIVERVRQAELRVNGGAADLRGVGVMHIGVAARSAAHSNILHTVLREDIGERGCKQDRSLAGYLRKRRFQRGERVVRVVVAHHEHVRGQTMSAGVAPGHHRSGVDTCDGWIDGVVVVEGDAICDERGEIGHERWRYLRGL